MNIEITMVDIICRIIAVVCVILVVILHFYERHKMDKWLKDSLKDEKEEVDNDPKMF